MSAPNLVGEDLPDVSTVWSLLNSQSNSNEEAINNSTNTRNSNNSGGVGDDQQHHQLVQENPVENALQNQEVLYYIDLVEGKAEFVGVPHKKQEGFRNLRYVQEGKEEAHFEIKSQETQELRVFTDKPLPPGKMGFQLKYATPSRANELVGPTVAVGADQRKILEPSTPTNPYFIKNEEEEGLLSFHVDGGKQEYAFHFKINGNSNFGGGRHDMKLWKLHITFQPSNGANVFLTVDPMVIKAKAIIRNANNNRAIVRIKEESESEGYQSSYSSRKRSSSGDSVDEPIAAKFQKLRKQRQFLVQKRAEVQKAVLEYEEEIKKVDEEMEKVLNESQNFF